MFKRIKVDVSVDSTAITFRFEQAVSILMAIVTNPAGQPAWQITAEEFRTLEDDGWELSNESVQSWPIDQAPTELLEAARMAEENFLARIREEGPRKPAIMQLAYGFLPPGYRSDVGPAKLSPGEHSVYILAEQGEGDATFQVAAV